MRLSDDEASELIWEALASYDDDTSDANAVAENIYDMLPALYGTPHGWIVGVVQSWNERLRAGQMIDDVAAE